MRTNRKKTLDNVQESILKTIALPEDEVKNIKQYKKVCSSTSAEITEQEIPFVWGFDLSTQDEIEKYINIAERLNEDILPVLKKLNLCTPENIANYISLSRGSFEYSIFRNNLLTEYMNLSNRNDDLRAIVFLEFIAPLDELVNRCNILPIEDYNPKYLIFDGDSFRANTKQIRNDHAEISSDIQMKTLNWIIQFNNVLRSCPVKMDFYQFLPFVQKQLVSNKVKKFKWWQANKILEFAKINFIGK